MKLNGALKPRQGASRQGSSPGVILKRYRVKRYFKVNENVVNGLPLNACGAKNKILTENNIINNICINNQQQQPATTPLSQQLEQKRKCGQMFSSSSSSSGSRINVSTLIKTKKRIYLTTTTTKQNTQTRVSRVTKTRSCHINLSSRRNKKTIQQTIASVGKAKAEAGTGAADAINEENYLEKIRIERTAAAAAVSNITTRQINCTKLNGERMKNKTEERKTKQVKYNNVTSNKSQNNKNNVTPKEVNKFLFISKIKENLILRLFIQLKLLLFCTFSHAIKYLNGNPVTHCVSRGRGIVEGCRFDCGLTVNNLTKMMSVSQLLERICFKNARGLKSPIALFMVIYATTAILLPQPVVGDDGDTFFPINGIETTTPEFDYASRGQKKFGDKCENTLECGFPGSICDPKKKSCQCTEDLPVTNHIDKCGKEAAVNESCFFNEQCEVKYFQTECRDQRCVCRFDMTPAWLKDGSVECKGRGDKKGPETYIDPAMIGVLIGMALMFIIICVVLRLFSQARWRENRTIFNTPNPRLMNVSLLRESKLLHGQERRGSRMSVRAPSRQPSMASLRPHSPNPSLGKTGSRSNSHGSNASATSLRSTRSNSVSPAGIAVANNSHHERKGSTYQPHQHQHQHPQQQKLQPLQQQQQHQEEQQHLTQHTNIISNPVAETVTVEIIEPEK